MIQKEEKVDLDRLYHPRSIAIVGVSRDFTTIGGKPLRNLIGHGYEGDIYPVNPRYEEVSGYPCYPSLSEVPGEVDVVLVAVSQARTVQVLEECAQKGAGFVMLFGAGFAEAGEAGEEAQREVVELARRSGIRLLGPNCIGCLNARDGIPMGFSTSFESEGFLAGPVALTSQSGAFGYSLFALAQEEGVGFSYVANTGNQADLDTLDFMSFMLEDESSKTVAGYLESIPDGDRLIRLAGRGGELEKPLVLLKAGRSALGEKAALSHTASLTGSDRAFRAVAEQYGIVSVNDIEDMVDAMKVFSRRKWAGGRRVAVVTTSGASGILLADYCEDLGLEMNPLQRSTRERIEEIIPSYGSAMNPVDLTAQALNERDIFREALRTLAGDEQVDAVVVATTFGRELLKSMCLDLAEVDRATGKPILTALTGSGDIITPGKQVLEAAGVPVYVSPYRTVKALSYLVRFSEFLREKPGSEEGVEPADPPVAEPGTVWTEERVKEHLSRLGVCVPEGRLLHSREEVESSAGELRYPVVAKVVSPEIPHKTEAGAVRPGIAGPEDLRLAYEEVLGSAGRYAPEASVTGVLVEEMVGGEGVEVFIGVSTDPQFGPLVVCGLGGIFAEVLEDTSIRRAPVGIEEARRMVSELKGYPLLAGVRGGAKMDVEAFARAVTEVSRFASRNRRRLREMDVNPVKVLPQGQGIVALDGMAFWG